LPTLIQISDLQKEKQLNFRNPPGIIKFLYWT